MRLIDADALRQTMYHEAFETDSDMQKWDGGCWIRYKMFENAIESAPTITPDMAQVLAYECGKAERKRGRWRHYECYLTCSECGEEYDDDIMAYCGDNVPKFCPNCGADMRAKETDCDYERAVEQLEHDMLYEPTYNQDDGSM